MDSGARIRLYSRLTAVALAALLAVCVALVRVHREEPRFGSLTIISYIVVEPEPRRQEPTRPPPPDPPARAVVAAMLGETSSQAMPRLWTYARGQIVFDYPEHYNRCVEARAAHHNEADCPDPHDPHPLALRP